LTADGRFRGEADKYKRRPWPPRSPLTQSRHATRDPGIIRPRKRRVCTLLVSWLSWSTALGCRRTRCSLPPAATFPYRELAGRNHVRRQVRFDRADLCRHRHATRGKPRTLRHRSRRRKSRPSRLVRCLVEHLRRPNLVRRLVCGRRPPNPVGGLVRGPRWLRTEVRAAESRSKLKSEPGAGTPKSIGDGVAWIRWLRGEVRN
jgi:hypothetical protein